MCVSVRCQGAPCSGAARTTNQIGFTKRNRNAKSVDAEGLRIALRRTPWVGLICERTWLGFCERSAMVPRTLLLATRGHCCLATKDGGDKLAYRRLGVWFARQSTSCSHRSAAIVSANVLPSGIRVASSKCIRDSQQVRWVPWTANGQLQERPPTRGASSTAGAAVLVATLCS